MKRILIIQTAFIGDVVLATAVAEKLHTFYPNTKIDFLLRKGNEALLKNHPFLNNVLVWDKKQGKLRNLWAIAKKVRKEKYDLVVNIHRHATSGFITWFSGAKEKRGFDQNPFSWCYTKKVHHFFSKPTDQKYIHETERNQWLIDDLTDEQAAKPALYPTLDDFEKVVSYKNEPYICIAPSSVWFTKKYPEERWVELIKLLPERFTLYFLSGAEDRDVANRIMQHFPDRNMHNLGGQLSLMQSAALMKNAAMNYTNDSGPLHFASSVNAPSTAIFCSTHACFGFGPLSDVSKLVEVQNLSCKPCGIHGYNTCPKQHFLCAKDIETQSLLWWMV
jgi:heptosyltransferase-2